MKHLFRFSLLASTLMLLVACTTTPTKTRNASISDVFDIASEELQEDRQLDEDMEADFHFWGPLFVDIFFENNQHRRQPPPHYIADQSYRDEELNDGADNLEHLNILLGRSNYILNDDEFKQTDNWFLRIGFEDNNSNVFGVEAHINELTALAGSQEQTSVVGPLSISYAINAEHQFLNEQALIRPFAQIGFGQGYLMWNFENPVIDTDGRLLRGDAIGYFELSTAIGAQANISNFIIARVQVSPQTWIFSELSDEGFSDDVFGAFLGAEVSMMMGLRL